MDNDRGKTSTNEPDDPTSVTPEPEELTEYEKALFDFAKERARLDGQNFDPQDPLAGIKKSVAEMTVKLSDQGDIRANLELSIRLFGKSDAGFLQEILKQYRDLPPMDRLDPDNDPTESLYDDEDDKPD